MKEKNIEKRVMKMKKVFVTLLMLMMVVGLFAAATKYDTAKVTATVGAVNKAWFAGESGTKVAPSEKVEKSLNNKEGKLDGTVSAEIYAVVDTNVTTGCEVSISGTALTLMENTATPDYSDSNYIALAITAQTGAEGSPLVYNAETPATEEPTGDVGTPIKFTITPSTISEGSGVAEQKLTIKVKDGAGNEKLGQLTAGEYWAWLIMTYSANA